MREVTYAEALYEALTEEMRRDERVFIMGEDVGRFGMIYLARPQLWKEFGDERVRDTPISENAIVGFTLGAAITGMRPVADIMFCDLLALAMDQLSEAMGEEARDKSIQEGNRINLDDAVLLALNEIP